MTPHQPITQSDSPSPCDGFRAVSETAPGVRLPNLLVIGAMKASTTTFYEWITRHPSVWFPSEKEPHYFTSPRYGSPDAWNAYCRLFGAAPKNASIIGEASTGYSKAPHFGDTPQRIRDDLGEVKLIYLVRDPVERAVSNFYHAYAMGHYPPATTFTKAIDRDPILLDASRYARQIRAYWRVFDREDLLIIPTDELHAHPARIMRRVEDFLSISHESIWDSPAPRRNSRAAVRQGRAIHSTLPAPILEVVRKLTPAPMRAGIKRLLPKPRKRNPQVAEAERELALARLAPDLEDLISILGASIAQWPSVRRLKEGS